MYRYDLTDAQWERIAGFFPDRFHRRRPGIPGRITGRWSTASSGTCTPAPPGPTRPRALRTLADRLRPLQPLAHNSAWARILDALLLRLDENGLVEDETCGASTPPSSAPTRPPPGRKKNPDPRPALGGPASMQRTEPEGHALGRSQGGFGTKTHLICDSRGNILAVWVTEGQRHETQGFEEVNRQARRPRRAGRPTWPEREAGDKAYSFPGSAAG